MPFFRAASQVFAIYTFIFAIFSPPLLQPHSLSLAAPAPAPSPSSDGTSIDQGIAYILMLVALVLTYLIHPFDAFSHQL